MASHWRRSRNIWTQPRRETLCVSVATSQVSARLSFLPPGSRRADVTPVGMTTAKDGKLAFVLLGCGNYVAFATPRCGRHDYVAVKRGPPDVALSADKKTLYVPYRLSADLSIIDGPTRKVGKAVPVGRAP
jgi:DNA-binding beta-propeller fold protein YncE